MPKMSLLNKVFEAYNGHRVAFSQQEAIAAIAVSAIASDGYLLEQETERVIVLLSQMEMFKSYSEKQITNMLNRLLNTLTEKGINNLVDLANDSLHPEYKETAFSLATDIILVDGVLSSKEQVFLTRLFQVLEMSTEKASTIFKAKLEIHQVSKKQSKRYKTYQNSEQ
ncbi:MAG: tellurite resistance TerB family protein [Okeania sp. SIO3I5]|uniref:tellurite resistance TerB family protein n=1 Tax=Okeania sp. SIO3I5 TaxID=2607805 RepID=UPI0013B9CF63|nr:tellurite resistance TerB family protein [Okeania sp. SIO3I5]NEQ40046.1 tellurite resistance TerB family protein [Okeania sp. SIO3I5]